MNKNVHFSVVTFKKYKKMWNRILGHQFYFPGTIVALITLITALLESKAFVNLFIGSQIWYELIWYSQVLNWDTSFYARSLTEQVFLTSDIFRPQYKIHCTLDPPSPPPVPSPHISLINFDKLTFYSAPIINPLNDISRLETPLINEWSSLIIRSNSYYF